jgi:hypothetical protein
MPSPKAVDIEKLVLDDKIEEEELDCYQQEGHGLYKGGRRSELG